MVKARDLNVTEEMRKRIGEALIRAGGFLLAPLPEPEPRTTHYVNLVTLTREEWEDIAAQARKGADFAEHLPKLLREGAY